MTSKGCCGIETAKHRLATAKTQESSALKLVRAQRAMLEIVQGKMAVALSQLNDSQREVEDAEKLLLGAEEERRAVDGDDSDDDIGAMGRRKVSAEDCDDAKNEADRDYVCTLQQQRRRRPASSPAPQLQVSLFNVSKEAKMILREVVLSAILHPTSHVDPIMLDQATQKGLSKQAVLNTVAVARARDRWNKEARQLDQKLLRKRGSMPTNKRGKIDTIIRANNDNFSAGVDAVQKKLMPKAA